VTSAYEPPLRRRRSMRAQRRIMFSRLVAGAVVLTIIAFFLVTLLLSTLPHCHGLQSSSCGARPLRREPGLSEQRLTTAATAQRRPLAPVEPLYQDRYDGYASFEDELDAEFYEPNAVWCGNANLSVVAPWGKVVTSSGV